MKFQIPETVTLPLTFLGDIHKELPDSDIRDVIGYLYFREEMSPDLKLVVRSMGHNSDQFIIQK